MLQFGLCDEHSVYEKGCAMFSELLFPNSSLMNPNIFILEFGRKKTKTTIARETWSFSIFWHHFYRHIKDDPNLIRYVHVVIFFILILFLIGIFCVLYVLCSIRTSIFVIFKDKVDFFS